MAVSNRDRVGRGLDLLSEGLYDVVDEAMTREYGTSTWNVLWAAEQADKFGGAVPVFNKGDVQIQLRAITERGFCFKDVLSRGQQAFAAELREVRNIWAHNEPISSEDAIRALDTMERLLQAVDSTASADDVHKLRDGLQRTVTSEQTRTTVRHHVDLPSGAGLLPWREVIHPHDDVASGNYSASEYAANLHVVALGISTSEEYSDPVEFFNRTYVTEGLEDLLARAIRRMSGDDNAAPVVNLQTNFGGGKTHSLLALYHLFGGTPNIRFSQEIQEIISRCSNPDVDQLEVRRVVLVGTYLKAGSPIEKPDGTMVNTIWGELAWQLGGREAYDIVADADRSGTNPGSALLELIGRYSPCLILIDEWVAYARQLVGKDGPAGTFDTQFTFAQNLTEVVSSVSRAMLVVSIPASADDTPETAGNDIEVGGENGQIALARLQNVIRRVAEQWRPSKKDEAFEIVKRRLFKEPELDGQRAIHATARVFVKMYEENLTSFPREAASQTGDYEKRIVASYPLHPEFFDRLYEDWSTLEKFQRTRGVLKLVSSIVHALWASEDSSPLIMPCTVPLDDTAVNSDLTQYLEDSWKPIIDADIDGPNSTAAEIDRSRTNLGQRHITRRIARTVFMGAAPSAKSGHRGLDKQRVWLGTAIPGDQLGNFATALDLLAQNSTFFYTENDKYWFDTQASITKTAREKAEQLREDPELVYNEIVRRLELEGRNRGVFDRVHVAPETGADVPEMESARLVIVHPRYTYKRSQAAEEAVATQWLRRAVESKGSGQRIWRNTLVFLVADGTMLESLESSVREYLGWYFVDQSGATFDLTARQQEQAHARVAELDLKVRSRLLETYVWAAYPTQNDPTTGFVIEFAKVSESAGSFMAERVAAKLFRDEQLISDFAPSILGLTLRSLLGNVWSRGEIRVGELWGYFIQYLYMPRLLGRAVLDRAIEGALNAIGFETLSAERFALAGGWDEVAGRYVDLVVPPDARSFQVTDGTLLVDWDAAVAQRSTEAAATGSAAGGAGGAGAGGTGAGGAGGAGGTEGDVVPLPGMADPSESANTKPEGTGTSPLIAPEAGPTRYFGSVKINSSLYAKDLTVIGHEILDRLNAAGAILEISLEIQATKKEGFTESEVRNITENSTYLHFDNDSGFEDE